MDTAAKEYYVYGLLDPTTDEVFYIGKGKGNRAEQHLKERKIDGEGNHNKLDKIKKILESNNEIKIIYYIKNINEEAAFFLEEILIDRIGRSYLKGYVVRDGNNVLVSYGPLTNLMDGGVKEYFKQSRITLRDFDEIDTQKISVDFAIGKYPELKEIIDSVPRTTKEDEIKNTKEQIHNYIMHLIHSFDPDIFIDIKANKIKGVHLTYGRAIVFDCEYGRCEICLGDDMEKNYLDFLKLRGKSAEDSRRNFVDTAYVFIMSNGKKIFESKSIPVSEIAKKIREYMKLADTLQSGK